MSETPSCSTCKTAEYLLIQKFNPARTERVTYETASELIHDTVEHEATASFHCMKCGASNGHTVPRTWSYVALTEAAKSTILAELGAEQGFSYPAPGWPNGYDEQGRVVSQKHG